MGPHTGIGDMNIFEEIHTALNTAPPLTVNLISSIAVIALMWGLRFLACWIAKRRISDMAKFYHVRNVLGYVFLGLMVILVARIWIENISSIGNFLAIISAGLAIALHDVIANIAGWLFIIWRKPFRVGERIEIGGISGDVIDIRLFQFSMIEVGNWVDADQSTGRIVHLPNSKALRDHCANYEAGFEYIWHEIPVLITFESNWEQAKSIMEQIAHDKTGNLSKGMQEQVRRAAMKYLIYFSKLTPIVYTTVKSSGVLLTMRYIVKPRSRRGSEQDVWEAILKEFAAHDDIHLAYNTTRYYTPEGGGSNEQLGR